MPKKKTTSPKKSRRPKTSNPASRPAGKKKAAKKTAKKKAASKRTKPTAATAPSDQLLKDRDAYKKHKGRAGEVQRRKSRAGREIKDLIDAALERIDHDRREACRRDFRLFCENYFPEFFDLGWSPAHLRVIERIETAVLKGGLFAVAMPRGSGKTTLSICAVVWAILYGHRRSVVLFGATKESAIELMTIIKAILEGEDYPELGQDFPEVSVPCAELEDKAVMTKGQLYDGQLTRMKWDADKVTLPRLDNSESSGSSIRTRGLGGHMRGMIHRDRGRIIRPDLVILDDPQTDESAMSLEETKKRYKVIDKGVRGLAGPGKRIAGIMPCTVIEPDDVADRILNGAPGWASERIPMIDDFDGVPEESYARWQELREIYVTEMNSDAYPKTNRFFKKHRKQLEAGIHHYWPARVEEGFVSAIQHAMCWYLTRPESFWSECQQKPQGKAEPDADLLTIKEVTEKQHGEKQNKVPIDADTIVSYSDVQGDLLYYVVMGVNLKTFSAFIIRYGTWPEQVTRSFKYGDHREGLADKYKGRNGAKLSKENRIRQAIIDCAGWLLNEEWEKPNGQKLKIERLAFDSRWETKTVRKAVSDLNDPRVMVSFGTGKNLTGKKQQGDRRGVLMEWRSRFDVVNRVRQLTIVTNPCKTFTHARWSTDFGEHGSLSLHKDEPHRHRSFAEQQRAEIRTKKADGDVFTLPPAKPDNHWFDAVVGCCVLAEHEGASLYGSGRRRKKRKRKGPRKAVPL